MDSILINKPSLYHYQGPTAIQVGTPLSNPTNTPSPFLQQVQDGNQIGAATPQEITPGEGDRLKFIETEP
jgi:hypothetical protein